MQQTKFYLCEVCGNLVGKIHDSGVDMVCCGKKMTQLIPGSVDAAAEKHVPEATVQNNLVTVNVGEVDHPMTEEHYIPWVYLQTKKGGQRKRLNPGDAPRAVFALESDEPVAVFAYCNLHGLWVKEF